MYVRYRATLVWVNIYLRQSIFLSAPSMFPYN